MDRYVCDARDSRTGTYRDGIEGSDVCDAINRADETLALYM